MSTNKIKTSKTFAKRVKVTKSGIVKMGRVGKRHNLICASKSRKRSPLLSCIHDSNIVHIRQMMPCAKVRKLS